jgi:hypothetical protein
VCSYHSLNSGYVCPGRKLTLLVIVEEVATVIMILWIEEGANDMINVVNVQWMGRSDSRKRVGTRFVRAKCFL